MTTLQKLFDRNRKWAETTRARDPEFFPRLARQQTPEYVWIGCSDSRILPNEIVGLESGEIFVHRNVANLVVHTDLNCLSVLQYAVDVLRVRHVIVCGHYGCGGVQAALRETPLGLIDKWLRHIQDVRNAHRAELDALSDFDARVARLCELNVVEQAANLCRTTVVEEAWRRGQELTVHGWIYAIHDGLLRDLSFGVRGPDELAEAHRRAIDPRR